MASGPDEHIPDQSDIIWFNNSNTKEIIALQEYSDKYISLYEGEVRNVNIQLANRLIEQGIVAEHDETGSGRSFTINGLPELIMIDSHTIDGESVNNIAHKQYFTFLSIDSNSTVIMNYKNITTRTNFYYIVYTGKDEQSPFTDNIKIFIGFSSEDDSHPIQIAISKLKGQEEEQQFNYDPESGNYIYQSDEDDGGGNQQ